MWTSWTTLTNRTTLIALTVQRFLKKIITEFALFTWYSFACRLPIIALQSPPCTISQSFHRHHTKTTLCLCQIELPRHFARFFLLFDQNIIFHLSKLASQVLVLSFVSRSTNRSVGPMERLTAMDAIFRW